jgi:hypothetical protein
MFSNKANRPKVANFKVYVLILMLVPVALLIKIQPAHALPATFQDSCFNPRVKLINVSQPEDGVLLTANCTATNPPGSGLPAVVTLPTELDLNGIDLTNNALTVPVSPVDRASTFQNRCISTTFRVAGKMLFASCFVNAPGSSIRTLRVTLQGISNIGGRLVYDYAEDGF